MDEIKRPKRAGTKTDSVIILSVFYEHVARECALIRA